MATTSFGAGWGVPVGMAICFGSLFLHALARGRLGKALAEPTCSAWAGKTAVAIPSLKPRWIRA